VKKNRKFIGVVLGHSKKTTRVPKVGKMKKQKKDISKT
jgi:hypothetical protein